MLKLQMGIIDMPEQNNDGGEQRLITVGDQAEVQGIAGEKLRKKILPPKDDS
jgi:hypothetical protein